MPAGCMIIFTWREPPWVKSHRKNQLSHQLKSQRLLSLNSEDQMARHGLGAVWPRNGWQIWWLKNRFMHTNSKCDHAKNKHSNFLLNWTGKSRLTIQYSRESPVEFFQTNTEFHGVCIERLVSKGYPSLTDFWYIQDQNEWALLHEEERPQNDLW